jgi:hypothetical protein
MAIMQLVPIAFSLLLIFFISVRKGHARSKIEKQLTGFNIMPVGDGRKPTLRLSDLAHIEDIVEDTCTYLGFLCGFITVLVGMGLAISVKLFSHEFGRLGVDSLIVSFSIVSCFLSLSRIWKDEATKLTQHCPWRGLRKFTYAQLYNCVLAVGYICLAIVLIT